MLRTLRKNKDKIFAVREWRKVAGSERQRECCKLWNQTSKGKKSDREKGIKYRHSQKGKECVRKWNRITNTKRRKLGFIPLNESFDKAVAHHIDFECIIYIPEFLHVSIPHNVWTWKGMNEINDKVFEWLENNLDVIV